MRKLRFQAEGATEPVEVGLEAIDAARSNEYIAQVGEARLEFQLVQGDTNSGWLRVRGQVLPFHTLRTEQDVEVWLAGRTYRLRAIKRTAARRAPPAPGVGMQEEIKAPMPGTILKIHVAVGESFEAHAPLIVMESMKMEMALSAPQAGRVRDILCEVGELVPMGQVLARLEAQ